MEFFVNGQKLDITLQDEKTIGDVLRAFEVSCEENKLATIGINVNGKNISAEDFDSTAAQELKDDTKIDVTVISEDSVADAFKKTSEQLNNVIGLLQNVPVEMQSGKDGKAKQSIIMLTDVMNNFCSTVTWASLFPERFGNLNVDGKNMSEFLAEFSPILKDFSDALENQDSVLIGDLAEYEICPRLESLSKSIGSY